MLNIFGYRDSRDLSALSIADYTESRAAEDIRRFADDYNRLVVELENDLATRGDTVKSKFGIGVGGEMQPYGEAGTVEATRGGDLWDVGYPINVFRSRKLYTEEYLQEATLGDLEQHVIEATVENFNTRRMMILRALLRKTNYDFDDGSTREWPRSGLGTIGVKRLVNNDSATGEIWVNGTKVSIGTLVHYFGSNSGTVAIAPFKTAYSKLKTVGYTNDVVFRISTSDESAVSGLTEFIPVEDTRYVDPQKKFSLVTSPKAIGRFVDKDVKGEVVVEPLLPAGYVFANDRAGGPDAKPVRIREHPLAIYRGFRLVQDQTKAPYGEKALRNKFWQYVAGAGVRNRVNGVAFQVVASTTYTDPTING